MGRVAGYSLGGETQIVAEKIALIQVEARETVVAPGQPVTFDVVTYPGTAELVWRFLRTDSNEWVYPDECRRMTSSCTFVPPSGGHMQVYGRWFMLREDYYATSEPVTVQQVSLVLRCNGHGGPVALTRGDDLSCEAATNPPGAALTDIRWNFTDTTGNQIPGPSGLPSWKGRMVVSGEIGINALLNGAPVSATKRITVRDRRWPRPAVRPHEEPATHLPSPANVTRPGHLADSHVDDAPSPPVTGVRIGEGPNAGWWYVANPIQDIRVTVHINEAAFQTGSAWYNLQTGGTWTDPSTGIRHPNGYCRTWQVPELRRLTREHEGSGASPVMSHVRAMQVYIANNAPQDSMANLIAWDAELKDYTFAEMIATHYRSYMVGHLTGYSAPHTTDSIPGVVPPAIFPCAPRPWY
jgi:hypothetical protein